MFDVFELQKKLVSVVAPSGFEKKRADIISEIVKPFVDEVYTDSMGNLIAHKKGKGKRIMLSAHMDTLGVIVKKIDDKGFLRIEQLGTSFPSYMICMPVRFANGVTGNICRSEKVTEVKEMGNMKNSDLYIDIGAKDTKEAKSLVRVGDYATCDLSPRMLAGGNMTSPYCDDITGCIALILAMEQVKTDNNDIYYVFSVQEEMRIRGAQVASHHIKPDIGIAIDVTLAGDAPEHLEETDVALGKGPVIIVKDDWVICTPYVVDILRGIAEKESIDYQDQVLGIGGTDASVMQIARDGAPVGLLSIPMRGIHLPVETINISDIENVGKILAKFVGYKFKEMM